MDRLELLEAAARADGDAGERTLGKMHRHLRLVAQPLVEALEERSAPGEHDAAVHDVGRQLGGRLVERRLDRVDDLRDGLLEGAAHLVGRDHDGLRQSGEHVTPAHLRLHLVREAVRGTDLELDLLSRLLADEKLVLLLDVVDDRLVHLVAAYAKRLRDDDASEGDHGHLSRAAANVDDHVPGRLADGQSGADRGGHRLLDQVGLARAGGEGCFLDRALLDTGDVHAVGVEAKRMLGRTPGTISAIRPLKDGVIADFDVTEQMLRHFIQKVHQHRFAHPRVVVCVPSGVTGVERRAVEEATLNAGARQAYLIEEPMAAAIGAGLPVAEPTGNMIVDIGGGTTEVAVISLGGIVVSQSLRVGGDEMDEAIVNHVKREYKLLIGTQTAEEIKLEIGSAWGMRDEVQAEVRGRDMLTGLPKTVILTSDEVRQALEEPVTQIIDAIKSTLDKTPPELAADIMDRGIVLAGGGALLHGLDERLRHETHMPMHLAESPLTCVAVGSGRSLEEFEAIHRSAKARARGRNHRP